MSSPGTLWAIACYFNPVPSEQRLRNFRTFRERLGVPLAVVEGVYREPELSAGDAEIVVQRPCEAVLWQKERLLNLAVEQLPADCDRVAILDADVIFADDDWAERVEAALDEAPLCQAFRHAHHLPRGHSGSGQPRRIGPRGRSIAALVAAGTPLQSLFGNGLTLWDQGCAPGLAWAARRSLLETHGLYEGCIVGGADVAVTFASQGEFDLADRVFEMNGSMSAHFRAWAEPFHADVRGRLGSANTTVLHLWHGDLDHRLYRERHSELARFNFDPAEDLEITESGCLDWATDKPGMHDSLHRYFRSREDG